MDISIIGSICNTGYGLTTANIVHSLAELGVRVSLFPINEKLQAHPKLHQSIQTSLKNAEMPNFEAPSIRIWHQFNMSQFVGHAQHIGFPIFELDTFTEQEKKHLFAGTSQLFTCSKWGQDVLIDNHDKWPDGNWIARGDIDIIPLGVDTEIFTPQKSFRKSTIFANFGKWETRKGHDILVRAFCEAFDDKDDVELWMMPHNPFLNEQETKRWVDLYKTCKLASKIKILPPVESHSQVADIMKQVDVGVFPCRAEGWNMEPLELMACGKRIIATNYSGQTEYLNEQNSTLIEPDGMELAQDGKWFFGQGSWSRLDTIFINTLIERLRFEHSYKKEKGSTIDDRSVETARRFTWKNTAEKIMEAIK